MISNVLVRWRLGAGLVTSALFMAACGGGGGSDLAVSQDRSAVEFAYAQGSEPAAQNVVLTVSGTLPEQLYTQVSVDGSGLDANVPATFAGNTASFALSPKVALAPGSYSGRAALSACTDVACKSLVGGAALSVTWRITVTPIFKAGVSTLQPSDVTATGASAVLPVQLPPGVTNFTASAVGDVPWLQLGTPTSDSLPVTFKPWRSGTWTATIALTANGQTIELPVRYVVPVPAGGEFDLSVAPTSLTMSSTENTLAAAQSANITLPSWGSTSDVSLAVVYPAGGASNWLLATRTSTGMLVAPTTATLPQGVYTASILVTPSTPGSAFSLPVSLTVGSGLVAPATQALNVNADTTVPALSANVPINATAGTPFNWSASSNVAWLRLITSAGSTGQSVSYNIDTAALQTLPNGGTLTGRITVTPGPAHMRAVGFDVQVLKRLPEVHFVGPATLTAGQTNTLHIRGSGFAALADPAASLRVGGYTPTAVTRTSDNLLVATLPPMVSEDVTVRVANALELSTVNATLRVEPARDYVPVGVLNPGAKRGMVYDARRQALFSANVGDQTLTRLRFVGGAWVLDSLAMPGILNVGMSPDGASIVVTQTPGQLQLINPDTLAVVHSAATPWPLLRGAPFDAEAIALTLDGRSWLGSDTRPDSLSYFDHRTRSFARRPSGPSDSLLGIDEPLLGATRNGMRMLAGFELSRSPLLSYDVGDPVLRSNSAGLLFAKSIKLSEDGSRVLLDNAEVRDRDMALVGRIGALPGGYVAVAGDMSPSGHRAYLLGIHNSVLGSTTEPSQGAYMPRLFVYISTSATEGTSDLLMLGAVDLPQYPSCRILNSASCSFKPRSVLSPDGVTLFYGGDKALVAMPVPLGLRLLGAPTDRAAAKSTVWPLGSAAGAGSR